MTILHWGIRLQITGTIHIFTLFRLVGFFSSARRLVICHTNFSYDLYDISLNVWYKKEINHKKCSFFLWITMVVPPNILDMESTPSSVAVRENQNINMTCRAEGFPQPKIIWRRYVLLFLSLSLFRLLLPDNCIRNQPKKSNHILYMSVAWTKIV